MPLPRQAPQQRKPPDAFPPTIEKDDTLSDLQRRLQLLRDPDAAHLLSNIFRGVEKESLRVNGNGQLATTPHPETLGSALTHSRITTDYSEALLEFITPPSRSVKEILQELENIHRYTYQQIGDELLWVDSMPCLLGRDNDIPVASYGSSNIGKMKHIYRIGLGHRYGRLMQTIAGIHYNFSLPDEFWEWLRNTEAPGTDLQTFKTDRYFGLIRNFRRNFWLLLYLFGAAPAVCKSFVKDRQHQLTAFNGDERSQHTPYATSLRMGDLGYQSKAQEALIVCYNSLGSYINALRPALTAPYPDYQRIGLRDTNGNYQQLNTHLLQIENEFYSTIRPKRTSASGETPLKALWDRGVEYIEVRCIDLNPYDPVGISAEQMYFLDIFLVHCLLQESPITDCEEYRGILENQRRTVYRGRDPELTLLLRGEEYSAQQWRKTLFEEMTGVAELLDNQQGTTAHQAALALFKNRLDHPEEIPSARILQEMAETGKPYFQVALSHAKARRDYFLSQPLDKIIAEQYREMAAESLARQRQIESSDELTFDQFLQAYYAQYNFPQEDASYAIAQ